MLMTRIEYARHREISRTRIAQYIADGLLPVSALKRIRGKKRLLINVEKADQALAYNLVSPGPGKEEEQIEAEAHREVDDFLRDSPLSDDFFQD